MALSFLTVLCGAAATMGLAMGTQAVQPGADWKPVPGRIMTRWAKDVTPAGAHPEYPRPMMEREHWQNLNGLWNYAIVDGDAPHPASADGRILVPFPVESALSGVGRAVSPEQTLWYWRSFTIPASWPDERVLLHFGAADWHTRVRVNGKEIGEHRGGFDPFSFDVTDALQPGDNLLEVSVKDPTDAGGQPRGKQWLKPHGIWYTPTTGIWQTVWLEPVPRVAIDNIEVRGSARDGIIRVRVAATDANAGAEVEVLADGKQVATLKADGGRVLSIKVPDPRAWSPRDPFLYDLKVRLTNDGRVTDEVTSYVGLRDITVGPDEHGVTRLLLNGEAIFQYGPLDQGFWPDGLYTAPTDEALKFDIEAVQRMGANMLRKHVKVEPQRFYTWCDRMGVLVWQDMPSPFFRNEKDEGRQPLISAEWKRNFENEMKEMVHDFGNHPSIVMWVPFNEGWGQNDINWSREMALKVKEWDPSRLVNNASGWTDMKVGDTYDIHAYPAPALARPEAKRAGVLGEFGGLGLPVEGHTWVGRNNWGYVSYENKEKLTEAYLGLLKRMPLLIGQGLSAAVYTQTTDVEIEVNGWLTYDREVWKIDPSAVKAATDALYQPAPHVRTLLSHAGESDDNRWRYTLENPGEGWAAAGFNDGAWEEGVAGFGRSGTPGAVIRTKWETPDIWIRRSFDAPDSELVNPHLSIHHDEDATVYINGEHVLSLKGYTTGYDLIPLSAEAKALLKKGPNTIAVHCHQTSGGQYIDVGLIDVVPPKVRPKRQSRAAEYAEERVAGFLVKLNPELGRDDPALLERVMVQLRADLEEIVEIVPAGALDTLRGVTVWVERQGYTGMGNGGRGLCCHWSASWLVENGLPGEKAGGVEIINAADFLSWRRSQPYMLLHELAHAFHWRLAGLDAEIDAAYRAAMEQKLYDNVERNTVPAGATVRAYAATNSHEYFAELSEAYFAVNDFAPYTRAQLAAHDPEGLRLVQRVWGMSATQIAGATRAREGGSDAAKAATDR